MDAYLRNGKDGDVDLDSRFHTGANLADITTNRILQGALLGDDARVRKAVADQFDGFATIDPYHLKHGVTDGYYADGSFIQHASVAYTGSYGKGAAHPGRADRQDPRRHGLRARRRPGRTWCRAGWRTGSRR